MRASNVRHGASKGRGAEMDLAAASGGWESSGECYSYSPDTLHLLKVTQSCLASVRSPWAMPSNFRRKATRRSSCALQRGEHRPARPSERNDRIQRLSLLILLDVKATWAVASASCLLQRHLSLLGLGAGTEVHQLTSGTDAKSGLCKPLMDTQCSHWIPSILRADLSSSR